MLYAKKIELWDKTHILWFENRKKDYSIHIMSTFRHNDSHRLIAFLIYEETNAAYRGKVRRRRLLRGRLRRGSKAPSRTPAKVKLITLRTPEGSRERSPARKPSVNRRMTRRTPNRAAVYKDRAFCERRSTRVERKAARKLIAELT